MSVKDVVRSSDELARAEIKKYGLPAPIHYNISYGKAIWLAQELLLKSLEIRKNIGDTIGLASSYYELGKCYFLTSEYINAKRYLDLSLKKRKNIEDPRRLSNVLSLHGKLLLSSNINKIQGIKEIEDAQIIQKKLGLKIQRLNSLYQIQNYYKKHNSAKYYGAIDKIKRVLRSLSTEQNKYLSKHSS